MYAIKKGTKMYAADFLSREALLQESDTNEQDYKICNLTEAKETQEEIESINQTNYFQVRTTESPWAYTTG